MSDSHKRKKCLIMSKITRSSRRIYYFLINLANNTDLIRKIEVIRAFIQFLQDVVFPSIS